MWGRIGRGGLGEGSERKKGREEREMISWERRRERRGEVYRELFISLFTHSHTNKKTDTHMFYIYILSPQTRTDSHLKTNFTLFASSTELRAWWRFNQFFLSPAFCSFHFMSLSSGDVNWKRPLCSPSKASSVIHFVIFHIFQTNNKWVTWRNGSFSVTYFTCEYGRNYSLNHLPFVKFRVFTVSHTFSWGFHRPCG